MTMKKKQKRNLYYLLAVVLLALAGYHGYQKNGFYKSAYNDELPTEQTQQDKKEGKEYQSTGDLVSYFPKFGFSSPLKIINAVVFPIPLVPTKPRT